VRPFSNAVLDGIDFSTSRLVSHLDDFAKGLKSLGGVTLVLTAAPQCPYPESGRFPRRGARHGAVQLRLGTVLQQPRVRVPTEWRRDQSGGFMEDVDAVLAVSVGVSWPAGVT
jgi:hypothetical protein